MEFGSGINIPDPQHCLSMCNNKIFTRGYCNVIIILSLAPSRTDLKAVGQSFGFVVPPHIDIGVAPSKKARPRKAMNKQDGGRFNKTKIYRQPNAKGKINFAR
jgi:hypothetical protein